MKIPHEGNDTEAWICPCGNCPGTDGFFPCDRDGTLCEPVGAWPGTYRCDRCGRVIDQATREILTPEVKTSPASQ